MNVPDLAGVGGGLGGRNGVGGEFGAEYLGDAFLDGSGVFPGDAHEASAALGSGANASIGGGEQREFDEGEEEEQEDGEYEYEFHGEHGAATVVLLGGGWMDADVGHGSGTWMGARRAAGFVWISAVSADGGV